MTDLSAESHAVQSVAVIAAWCENPTHLPVLDSAVQEYLEEPEHFRACSTVARNWDPTEAASPALRSLLESQSRQGTDNWHATVAVVLLCFSAIARPNKDDRQLTKSIVQEVNIIPPAAYHSSLQQKSASAVLTCCCVSTIR